MSSKSEPRLSESTTEQLDSLLKTAAQDGALERVLQLCRHGASTIEMLGGDGNALHIAAAHGNRGVVMRLLQQCGADAHMARESDGKVALAVAIDNGYSDLATILCQPALSVLYSTGDSAPSSYSSSTELGTPSSSSPLAGPSATMDSLSSAQALPSRTTDLLVRCVLRTNLLGDMEKSDVVACVGKSVKQEVLAGQVVMTAREAVDSLIIVERGDFEIRTIHKDTQVPTMIAATSGEAIFGDLPVYFGAKSPCSVVATSGATIWRLRKEVFLDAVARANNATAVSSSSEAEEDAPPTRRSNWRLFSSKKAKDGKKRGFFGMRSSRSSSTSKHGRARTGTNDSSDEPPPRRNSSLRRPSTGSCGSDSSNRLTAKQPQKGKRSRSHSNTVKGLVTKIAGQKRGQPKKPSVEIRTRPNPATGKIELIWKLVDAKFKAPPQVMAGSPPALIHHVVDPNFFENYEYMRQILTTYGYFTTPTDLAQGLISAFDNPPEESNLRKLLFERVIRLFCSWTYTGLFTWDRRIWQSAEALKMIVSFAERVSKVPTLSQEGILLLHHLQKGPQAHQALEVIHGSSDTIRAEITQQGDNRDDLVFQVESQTTLFEVRDQIDCHYRSKEKDTISVYLDASAFEFRSTVFGSNLENKVNVREACIASVIFKPVKVYSAGQCLSESLDPEIIAHVMTYLDHQTFSRIQPEELVNQAWTKSPDQAPNICELTERFNNFCNWGVTMILREPRVVERAKVIEQLIEVGDMCESLNNFHGVTQILAILKNPAIARLRLSWSKVDETQKSVFGVLDGILDPRGNRAKYRGKLETIVKTPFQEQFALGVRKCSSPCLPYLGMFLSDIVFCEDGNKDELPAFQVAGLERPSPDGSDDCSLTNFYKYRSLSKILEDLRSYQMTPYLMDHLDGLTADKVQHADWYLVHGFTALSEDDAWDKSVDLEIRGSGESHQRLRSYQDGERTIGNFKWLTCDDRGAEGPNHNEGKDSNSGADSDEWRRWYSRFSNKPIIDFIGSFEYDENSMNIDSHCRKFQMKKKGKNTTRSVLCEIKDDEIIISGSKSKDLILKRPLAKIDFYKYDAASRLFFFIAVEYKTKFCHVFQDQNIGEIGEQQDAGSEASAVFVYVHRMIKRWSKSSQKASQEARTLAFEKLNTAPVGTFVVRDSASRAGCYALSMKLPANVVHFLVERTRYNKVRFKDSDYQFDNLRGLIIQYCVYQLDLPNKLRPEGSFFFTDDCERIPSNMLPEPDDNELARLTSAPAWYLGPIPRLEAERLLLDPCTTDGQFLVRESSSGRGTFAISFLCERQVVHVLVTEQDGGFAIDGKVCAEQLADVVEICCAPDQKWLPVTLTSPVSTGVSAEKPEERSTAGEPSPSRAEPPPTQEEPPASPTVYWSRQRQANALRHKEQEEWQQQQQQQELAAQHQQQQSPQPPQSPRGSQSTSRPRVKHLDPAPREISL